MAAAYPGFCSMKQLRILLLPPGWDASPSQGYFQQYVASTHFIPLGGETMWGKVSCLRKQHDWGTGLGLEPPTFRSEVQCANHYTTVPFRGG